MSTAQRIKGQEVSILITRAGVLEDTLTDIQNFNLEFESEIKSVGYLGEKNNRKDDIFNGVKFDFELHVHTQDFLAFQQAILARQRRQQPDLTFTISGVLFFPNQQTPTFTIADAKFGATPINIASRGDYVKVKFQGEAEEAVVAA